MSQVTMQGNLADEPSSERILEATEWKAQCLLSSHIVTVIHLAGASKATLHNLTLNAAYGPVHSGAY